ncbi:hypothetical protein [Stigmatella erecta]|uniref:Uncharacterized protein n=1 Tax=Stigmatella erecta TaxID=83460 RepID=A0A1I0CKH7_9BACT|nr:hypothetical protein [Stigmatella erecta]SET19681.1 hypothetical protein SAMN05443639_102141 [Stigmatella erecta]
MGLTRSPLSSCLAVREHTSLVLAALLCAVLAGCGDDRLSAVPELPSGPSTPSPRPTAPAFTQIEFQAHFPQSPFASEITSAHVQILGPPQAATTVPLSKQGDTWKGSVVVPTTAEGYYFAGRAFNASTQFLFQSTASTPPAGPEGLLNVVLPFELRTPLPFTQIEFQAQLPQSPFASEITSVHVQIAGPSPAQTIVSLFRQGDTWKGSVRVPTTAEGYYLVGRALNASTQFLFESITHVPPAGPEGLLNVVLPFELRTPLPFTQIEFQAQLPQSELASEVTSVHVEIAGPPPVQTIVHLSRQGDTWKGSVRIPTTAEDYYFVGRALNASNRFLFESVVSAPAAGPDGILNVALPFQPRAP